MMLETKRLYLIPLTAKQLELWINDLPRLEKDLNCQYFAEPLQGFFLEIVAEQLKKTKKDEKNYLYHTFWFLIRKSDNVVVGLADFKDIPNLNHEIEIGYGLGENFRHQGFMTEAVQIMCDWAINQTNVSFVIAETEIDNSQSQNILKSCGFVKYKQSETAWWKLS
ncbi:GNAT family N-acetyltransferase [Enterococcus alishanensis]|uniref:GNAT family N-acetyltransferase n=1 Tax=Enterococcus alishanensis TaxID=1303817 RepID=A0ABS6THV9_9ENTE|nr:GNAT family N-acetyltransferase [Enterococcus alishanensis]MBV7392510.1 GNAT family N-acetyltransferase [Enterococcus alishanensis]